MNARDNFKNADANISPARSLLQVNAFWLSVWAVSSNWAFCKEHPGLVASLIGVAGESILDWKDGQGLHGQLKKFFMMLLIGGMAVELYETQVSDRELAHTTKLAGEANERAGIAEREAQRFRLKADELEKQIIETTNNLAKINPRNLPLTSLTAFVRIEYRTNHVESIFWDANFAAAFAADAIKPRLELSRRGKLRLDLSPSGQSRLIPEFWMQKPSIPTTTYVRKFEWDKILEEEMHDLEIAEYAVRPINAWGTNELMGNDIDEIDGFSMAELPLKYKTEVIGGHVDLFVNGLKRRLLIPPQMVDSPVWAVEARPDPFTQARLGATNWYVMDTNGSLVKLPMPTNHPAKFRDQIWNF